MKYSVIKSIWLYWHGILNISFTVVLLWKVVCSIEWYLSGKNEWGG